jgi:hypothetical protein
VKLSPQRKKALAYRKDHVFEDAKREKMVGRRRKKAGLNRRARNADRHRLRAARGESDPWEADVPRAANRRTMRAGRAGRVISLERRVRQTREWTVRGFGWTLLRRVTPRRRKRIALALASLIEGRSARSRQAARMIRTWLDHRDGPPGRREAVHFLELLNQAPHLRAPFVRWLEALTGAPVVL